MDKLEPATRSSSSLVCIRNRKILVAQSNKSDHWTLPSGKSKEGEEPLDCLRREMREEFSGAEIISPEYLFTISGISPRQKKSMIVNVFTGELSQQDLLPSREVVGFCWVTYDEVVLLNLSDLSRDIIERLRSLGLL